MTRASVGHEPCEISEGGSRACRRLFVSVTPLFCWRAACSRWASPHKRTSSPTPASRWCIAPTREGPRTAGSTVVARRSWSPGLIRAPAQRVRRQCQRWRRASLQGPDGQRDVGRMRLPSRAPRARWEGVGRFGSVSLRGRQRTLSRWALARWTSSRPPKDRSQGRSTARRRGVLATPGVAAGPRCRRQIWL